MVIITSLENDFTLAKSDLANIVKKGSGYLAVIYTVTSIAAYCFGYDPTKDIVALSISSALFLYSNKVVNDLAPRIDLINIALEN